MLSLTSRIELSTSVLSGDSSTRRFLRMRFLALCTMLETDSLWMGTDAGSVSLDSAWVMSLFSTETPIISLISAALYTVQSDSEQLQEDYRISDANSSNMRQIKSLFRSVLVQSVNQRIHTIRQCSVIWYINNEHAWYCYSGHFKIP